jgi:hypothetical protein
MELKKPRSRAFKSGKFGGCCNNLMSHPDSLTKARKIGSFGRTCVRALSCWTKMVPSLSGHIYAIDGITFSQSYSLITCLVTMMVFSSIVPFTLFLDLYLAAVSLKNAHIPIFPSNVTSFCSLYRSLAIVVKNITFPIYCSCCE